MSGYIRSIELKIPFEGREVAITMGPLTRADLFQIEAMGDVKDTAIFQFYADRLPSYIKAHDVRDAAGGVVPIEEWSTAAYFVQLVTAIMVAHIQRARPENP